MLVRSAFCFFNVPSGQNPTPLTYWEGVEVTIYANGPDNRPNEQPTIDGGHTNQNGGPVATQFVPVQDLSNQQLVGTWRSCYLLDIPVNLVVAKNTKYWLSLMPRFNAPPQAAWCISETPDLGFAAVQGASFGIPFWTTIAGNYGYDPNGPPAGTHRELAVELYGVPEPAVLSCLLVGGLVFMYRRRERAFLSQHSLF